MTSAINPLYPVEGTPTTESVRENFEAAKTEIEALQTGKQDTLISGSTIKTVAGKSVVGAGNVAITKEDVGLPNVDNTSDASKPVSTAQEGAIMTAAGSALTAANNYTDDELAAHVAAANPHEQYALKSQSGFNEKLLSFANNVLEGTSACANFIGDSKTTSDAGTTAYPRRIANLVSSIVSGFSSVPAVHYYEFDYATAAPRKLKPRVILQAGNPIAQTFRTGVSNKNIPRISPFPTDKTRMAIQLSIKPVSDIPSVNGILVRAAGGHAGTFCYSFYIEATTGDLVFAWSANGTDLTTNRVTKAQLGTAIQSGVQKDIAVEFIGDNGASGHTVKFYTSPAFADTWTEITAAAYTGVGVTSLYALDTTVDTTKLGANSTNVQVFEGEIYDVKICTHLQGGIQCPPVYEWMPLGNLLNDNNLVGTATISIFGCGYPGIKSNTMINQSAMFPRFDRGFVSISTSDNEDTYGATLYGQLEQLRTKIEAVYPYTPKAVILVNYNISPFANKLSQRYRVDFVNNWGVENNLEIINCTGTFARQANFGAAFIKADGQHPTQNNPGNDGQTLVTNQVVRNMGLYA